MADRGAAAGLTNHRFFLDPAGIQGDHVRFTSEQSKQIQRVLRLRPGDRVTVLDGRGQEYITALHFDGRQANGRIESQRTNLAEPLRRVTLYQGLLKAAKLEWVWQKGTELGVSRFVPVACARAVAHDPSAARQQRWETIVREAAEQSRRGVVPVMDPVMSLDRALTEAAAGGPAFFLWEGEATQALAAGLLPPAGRIALFVGPEGGFTPEEASRAAELGVPSVTLGPLILRAETAALAAAALVLLDPTGAHGAVDTSPKSIL